MFWMFWNYPLRHELTQDPVELKYNPPPQAKQVVPEEH